METDFPTFHGPRCATLKRSMRPNLKTLRPTLKTRRPKHVHPEEFAQHLKALMRKATKRTRLERERGKWIPRALLDASHPSFWFSSFFVEILICHSFWNPWNPLFWNPCIPLFGDLVTSLVWDPCVSHFWILTFGSASLAERKPEAGVHVLISPTHSLHISHRSTVNNRLLYW